MLEEFPEDAALARGSASPRGSRPGASRPDLLLGYGERHRLGLRFNDWAAGRDLGAHRHRSRSLDSGSWRLPTRDRARLDGPIDCDWPLLNGLVNASSGATWVSIHHGGASGSAVDPRRNGVRADGTSLAAEKLEAFSRTPATGVIRHVDAGYDIARLSPRNVACACR